MVGFATLQISKDTISGILGHTAGIMTQRAVFDYLFVIDCHKKYFMNSQMTLFIESVTEGSISSCFLEQSALTLKH